MTAAVDRDYRLVAASRLAWNENAWREPARVALMISALRQITEDESAPFEAQAEAKHLIEKLYKVSKAPTL